MDKILDEKSLLNTINIYAIENKKLKEKLEKKTTRLDIREKELEEMFVINRRIREEIKAALGLLYINQKEQALHILKRHLPFELNKPDKETTCKDC